MTTKAMRDQLKRAYPDKRWAKMVDEMTPAQVSLAYISLMAKSKSRWRIR